MFPHSWRQAPVSFFLLSCSSLGLYVSCWASLYKALFSPTYQVHSQQRKSMWQRNYKVERNWGGTRKIATVTGLKTFWGGWSSIKDFHTAGWCRALCLCFKSLPAQTMKEEYKQAVSMCPTSAPYTWLGLSRSSWVENWAFYVIIDFHSRKLQASLTAALKMRGLCFKIKLLFWSGN